ncbi:MAG: DUF5658 family protein [Burkholderiales bacterium]
MISFLKCCSLGDIKNKMVMIFILNVTDIVFTLILCGTGLFVEANPVAAMFVGNRAAALLVKSLVPAALLSFLYFRMQKATAEQLKKANVLIVAALMAYVVINVSHISWISVLLINPGLFI